MKKIFNLLKIIFSRNWFLYALIALILLVAVDKKKVDIKILNHLRDSARYVNKYALDQVPYNKAEFYDASEYYNKLMKTMPDLKLAAGVLGYCYYQLGQYSTAAIFYEKAINENPQFFGFYHNLGLSYLKLGDKKKAMIYFKKSSEISMNESVNYLVFLSTKYFKGGNNGKLWLAAAIENLTSGVEQNLKNIILIYDEEKKYQDILYLCEGQLNSSNVKDREFFYFYAGKAAYYLQGYKQAIQFLNAAISLNGNNKEAYDYAVKLLEAAGQNDLVRIYQDKAMQIKEAVEIKKEDKLIYYMPYYEVAGTF